MWRKYKKIQRKERLVFRVWNTYYNGLECLEKEGLLLSAKELDQIEQEQKVVLDQEIICFCKALSITVEQLFEDISL